MKLISKQDLKTTISCVIPAYNEGKNISRVLTLIGQAEKDSGSARKLHQIVVDGLDSGQKYYLEIHSNAKAYGEEGEPLSVRTLP